MMPLTGWIDLVRVEWKDDELSFIHVVFQKAGREAMANTQRIGIRAREVNLSVIGIEVILEATGLILLTWDSL